MNTDFSPRTRTFVSGLAAAAVTTVLVSSLIESFDPVQLLRLEDGSAAEQVARAELRRDGALVREA